MLGILGADPFQQRSRFRRFFLAQQTLPQVCPGIDVLCVTFQRRPICRFRLVQFSLLKINIAQLEIMMCLVEMVDLGLEFLDAFAILRAGQLESARGGRCAAINIKKLPEPHSRHDQEDP